MRTDISRIASLAAVLCIALAAAAALGTTAPRACTDEASEGQCGDYSLLQVHAHIRSKEVDRVPLFCFLVVQTQQEASLLNVSYGAREGIFGCDEFVVFSNVSANEIFAGFPELLAGVQIEMIPMSFDSPLNAGSKALVAPIFWEVWKRLYSQGTFRRHDWVVKVDPDTVFISERLRRLLENQCEGRVCPATYLPNLPGINLTRESTLYLHGSIEVLSRGAVDIVGDAIAKDLCMTEEWPTFGEDFCLQSCLTKLGVLPADNAQTAVTKLLWRFEGCDTDHVAFHPHKKTEGFAKCLAAALDGGGSMDGESSGENFYTDDGFE